MRQIALVGQDIDWSTRTICSVFDTHVAYRDPGIVPAFGGMFNALMSFGDCFLEVVSPTDRGYEQDSTTARLLRKFNGDCGYMTILQVDDIARTSSRMAKFGRVVLAGGAVNQAGVGEGIKGESSFRYKVGSALEKRAGTTSFVNVQWHPKDFGTLLETEEQWPVGRGAAGAWMPAGNRWQRSYSETQSSVCREFAAVEIALPPGSDSATMAKKWAEGLEVPIAGDDGTAVQLDGSQVRFVSAGADGRFGIVAIDVYAAPGKPKAFLGSISLGGVRWTLVDRQGAEPSLPLFTTLRAERKAKL